MLYQVPGIEVQRGDQVVSHQCESEGGPEAIAKSARHAEAVLCSKAQSRESKYHEVEEHGHCHAAHVAKVV